MKAALKSSSVRDTITEVKIKYIKTEEIDYVISKKSVRR
jgi:hypothetical protein